MSLLTPVLTSCLRLSLLVFFLPACHTSGPAKKKPEVTDSIPVSTPWHKPASGYLDTLRIDRPAAVFFSADSMQLLQLQKSARESVLESTEHECFFQMKNIRTSLQQHWPRIRIYHALAVRYLLFSGKEGKEVIIDLDSVNDLCGVYLFTPAKAPQRADMMNAANSLEYYFLK